MVAGAGKHASAQPPQHVSLYAAGSLKSAMTEIAAAFTKQTGIVVDPTYGSSGTLRDRIENGAAADVFASADTANPLALQRDGKSGPVSVFTHNRLCLLVKSDIAGTRDVVSLMLDPAVRLITSMPGADPAGDYTEQLFKLIDMRRTKSLETLDAKALRLIGGAGAVPIPAGTDPGTYLLLTANRGDALLAYCSGFAAAVAAHPTHVRSLEMPSNLSVRAEYGMVLRQDPSPAARALRDFILSDAAQTMLVKAGFSRT